MNAGKRFLLGQLGKKGDCLYATAVARQIKNDFPNCHLTWAISSSCRSVIEGNPYVDEIWEIYLGPKDDITSVWYDFELEAIKRKENGEYDEIFLTQVPPANFHNYDGTSRSSIFRGYPNPITVPVQPIVRLSDVEIENARKFVETNNISNHDIVILFECSSSSGQSFVTPEYALITAEIVLQKKPNVIFILSSDKKIITSNPNIIDASMLGFKENAELTKYCSLLVGCSSGISWLSTSDWAKELPKIQLLEAKTHMFASMLNDAKFFNLHTHQILEMQNCSPQYLADCIILCLEKGIVAAKNIYQKEIPLKFNFFFQGVDSYFLKRGEYMKACRVINLAKERFHYDTQGIYDLNYITEKIFFCYLDLFWDKLKEQEKKEIKEIMNYRTPRMLKFFTFINNITLILIKSLFGKHTFISRIFLKDIIIKFTKTDKFFK